MDTGKGIQLKIIQLSKNIVIKISLHYSGLLGRKGMHESMRASLNL